jgi:hypothetical protein
MIFNTMENNTTVVITLAADVTVEDILNSIKDAKQKLGLSTDLENTLLNAEVSVVFTEKKPWYVRFWNWIARKK